MSQNLIRAFTVYVRPMMEYCSPLWSPVSIQLVNQLESVQRRFTKRLPGFSSFNDERCTRLAINSLELCCVHRTEKPRQTKIGIEVAHVTRDSDTTFKLKRSKVKVTRPLYSPQPLTRQAAAAVSVGTYWPWEPTDTLRCARRL